MTRSVQISVLATSESTPTSWPLALASNVLRTIGMFGWVADKNWRFNPAGRPAFDLLISVWVFLGAIFAVWRWRSLPHLFVIVWLRVLALPALLSNATPHSLRMIGVLPAACLLVALAMLEVGRRLAGRRQWLAAWLPLPFLLLSGAAGLYDYFSTWQRDNPDLKQAFDTGFVEAVPVMLQDRRPEGVWITPVWPVYSMPESNHVVDFLTRRQIAYGTVKVGKVQSPDELRNVTGGHGLAICYVGEMRPWSRMAPMQSWIVKICSGSCWKSMAGLWQTKTRAMSVTLPGVARFTRLPGRQQRCPGQYSFGGKLKLTGLAYGHTHDQPRGTRHRPG